MKVSRARLRWMLMSWSGRSCSSLRRRLARLPSERIDHRPHRQIRCGNLQVEGGAWWRKKEKVYRRGGVPAIDLAAAVVSWVLAVVVVGHLPHGRGKVQASASR
jgi:hypothetical protein